MVNTDMESFICNDTDLEVFWIRDVTIIWSTMPKMYEGESKSKVNLPVEVLQSTQWETYSLSEYSHDLHTFFEDGGTTFKWHCCRTASCDLFFGVKRR